MPQFADVTSINIGDASITFLADGGGVVDPLALYPASESTDWQNYPQLLDGDGKFITSIGAFLIQLGERKIAVDMGIGPVSIDFPGFGPFSGGRYLESLARTGVKPEDVTDVIFTHLHLDHVGWVSQRVDGRPQLTYPNARYFVSQVEWEFWYGGDNPAGPDPELVQQALVDRIEFLVDGAEILPGLTAFSTPGHTPGHMSLRYRSGNDTLYLLGDVLHGVMQLAERDWTVAFDVDPELARESREALYPQLAMPNTLVAVNHFSDAVFGRITATGDGYNWVVL